MSRLEYILGRHAAWWSFSFGELSLSRREPDVITRQERQSAIWNYGNVLARIHHHNWGEDRVYRLTPVYLH